MLPAAKATMSGNAMTFALTTIVFQSVVFYFGFGSRYVFPARSERLLGRGHHTVCQMRHRP